MIRKIIVISREVVQRIYLPRLLLAMLFSLSGCGGYGSTFACKDARGLNCMPLRIVDQQINSGEIARVELQARKKCQGRNCYAKNLAKPDINANKVYEIKLQQETDQKVLKNGNVLYIK